MTTKRTAMFYCQHVLGLGHFIRSTEIVRGLTGFDVCFLNGGEIVSGLELPASIEVINLPPIKADAEFREIYPAAGPLGLEAIREIRKARIIAEYERTRPDLLVIELFPFGRRKFAFELLPLLERLQADGRTKVVCSLRDILVSKRDQARFDEQAIRLVNQFFDLVLVHSDPQFQRLEETFSGIEQLRCPVEYTGFVAQPPATDIDDDSALPDGVKKIIVSIGGGRVGCELIDCAIEASDIISESVPHRMLIFTGPYLPDEQYARLQEKTAGRANIRLERFTTQFISQLRRADLSVSMAGYNTCMNLLTAGTPAIVCPFTGNNNEEQTIRAAKLQQLGVLKVIHQPELSAVRLAEMMTASLSAARTRCAPALDLRGVERTAAILTRLVAAEAMEVKA
ncbi:MAG TPA: glycosyltransferase [Blastocatellia bacterium]|nr:glycosyltransferase [Blastocatellia bacterium]